MRNPITIVAITSVLMYIAVFLDIPILRQVIGFFYLLFIPGFVLLKIFKLDDLNAVDKILLAVGLSIALSMLIGLLMNELYPIFGVTKPLSTLPLMLTISTITFLMSIISYLRNDKSLNNLTISSKFIFKALLLVCLPILAVCGAWFNSSYALLLMVSTIAFLTVATVLPKQYVSTKLYLLITIIIASSLLFQFSLVSKFLTGWDVFLEYPVYNLTNTNSFWNVNVPLKPQTLNSMLSISILPTMFSRLLNIQGEWIFKLIYPLIFSFVPLILFRTWEEQTGKRIAFLSAFLFMVYPRFSDTSEMRQVVAEIFLALLLFLIINKKIPKSKRGILLVIFGFSLVVSHYSTSYIFLFTIFFAWFFSLISRDNKSSRRTISVGFILVFLILAFSWYTYISSAPSNVLLGFLNNIRNSFSTDFFNLTSRGGTISEFANPFSSPSTLHLIGNLLGKIPYLFIVIGFLGFFIHRLKNTEVKFDGEYNLMMVANAFILFAVILIPNFGPGLVTTRFFHLTLFLLAPLFIVGGQTFFKLVKGTIFPLFGKSKSLKEIKALSLVLIVFVGIFLFKTGFVYEVAGDVPTSPSLSKASLEMSNNVDAKQIFYGFYVQEQDVFSARWLSNVIENNNRIYADSFSRLKVLVGYGMFTLDRIYTLQSNVSIDVGGYIYLRYENVIDKQVRYLRYETERSETVNITEVSFLLNNSNKIYSNGFSEVYQSSTYLNVTGK